MQSHTISAMFEDYSSAAGAVERLKAAGIRDDDISIVGRSGEEATTTAASSTNADATDGDNTATGATLGAVVGGGAGLLAGLGMLAIPGLGPVVAAGWLASLAVGAAAGGAAGGLIGALTESGVPEDEAHRYAEGIRRGHTLVTVRAADSRASEIVRILDEHGTVDMDERSAAWRNEGWSGRYDEHAPLSGGYAATAAAGIPPAAGMPHVPTVGDDRSTGATGYGKAEDEEAPGRDRSSGQDFDQGLGRQGPGRGNDVKAGGGDLGPIEGERDDRGFGADAPSAGGEPGRSPGKDARTRPAAVEVEEVYIVEVDDEREEADRDRKDKAGG